MFPCGKKFYQNDVGGFSLEFTPLRSALKTHILPLLLYIVFPSTQSCQIRRQKAQERHAATVGGSQEL